MHREAATSTVMHLGFAAMDIVAIYNHIAVTKVIDKRQQLGQTLRMTRGKDTPTATRTVRREGTRAALIAAAHALAMREGADPLDPAQIAQEVGVSRPLFYAHFRTRGEFVDALLASLHGDAASPPPPLPEEPSEAVLAFFEGLAAPLDRNPELARRIIPASHLPGPVAEARAKRREKAIAKIASLLPPQLCQREERAAFLMDAFLGVQLAWSKADDGGSLAARVRRDLRWALTGALSPDPSSPAAP